MESRIKELSTLELKAVIEGVALAALDSFESRSADELCDMAHEEVRRREQERGEYVRLSNLTKNYFGDKAYVCGIMVDGVTVNTFYETNADKAKSYRRYK